jgi:hypothetical protein
MLLVDLLDDDDDDIVNAADEAMAMGAMPGAEFDDDQDDGRFPV